MVSEVQRMHSFRLSLVLTQKSHNSNDSFHVMMLAVLFQNPFWLRRRHTRGLRGS
jgi:hypothetical protein